MQDDTGKFVEWFRSASPYIRVHRGRTFVVQFDDTAVADETFNDLIHDLALLNSLGIRLVLVFGTRSSIEQRLEENGIALDYHNGIRITTGEAMECVKEAAGKLRVEIEARLSMGLGNSPMTHANLRVSSGNYVAARPMGIVEGIDFQLTGEVRSIDVNTINTKLHAGEIVLIAPIGYSTTGECFNLNAEQLAAQAATALNADKLIYLMEARGLSNDQGELIRQLNQLEAESLLKKTDEVTAYHNYLRSAVTACKHGVHRIHLIDRHLDGAIIQELFTRDGAGTMVSSTPYDVIRQATIEDIPGLMILIEPLEKDGILVQRSREKLELEVDNFTVMERDGVIIGCGALYPLAGTGAAELACLVIHRDYHRCGRGELLLGIIEDKARSEAVKRLFLLTTHAEHWFLEQGFINARLEDLPVERKTLYNYQRKSKILVKTL